ncbi:NAD(P)H-dependent oxidoreductase [Candidatus Uhrbacteria bacterium]|nr:NAD(P)H-dependent oxidoreductase [Candidatus Uhrbacteria bacterium]
MPHIVVLLGSTRHGRASEGVARYITAQLQILGASVTLVDALEILKNHPLTETDIPAWMEIASRADGFVVVSPEYNHGYPGAVKMVLDGAYDEYEKKPVGFVGVSSGPFGGIRAIEQLRQVCVELGLVAVHEQMLFGFAKKAVAPDGTLLELTHQPRMEIFGKALLNWVERLTNYKIN